MNIKIITWLAISILFEIVGDVGVKRASLTGSLLWWSFTLIAYNLMLVSWFIAINEAKVITIPGTIWLLCGQLALVAVGYFIFKEHVSKYQLVGILFASLSLVFLSI